MVERVSHSPHLNGASPKSLDVKKMGYSVRMAAPWFLWASPELHPEDEEPSPEPALQPAPEPEAATLPAPGAAMSAAPCCD